MKSIVKWPLISGSVLFLCGPLIAIVGTIIGMVRTFFVISSSGGSTDAETLSSEISASLLTTLIGIPIAIVGLLLLLFAFVAFLITQNQPTDNV